MVNWRYLKIEWQIQLLWQDLLNLQDIVDPIEPLEPPPKRIGSTVSIIIKSCKPRLSQSRKKIRTAPVSFQKNVILKDVLEDVSR